MPPDACEVCGKRVEKTIRISYEDIEVNVCPSCFEKLGRRARIIEETRMREAPAQRREVKPRLVKSSKIESMDIVENYGELVRKARQERGWTQEVLAQKLRVSVDVVKRIESEKYKPPIDLARKIEKLLKIKLLVSTEEEPLEETPGIRGATLGEVVVVRREDEGED